MAEPLAPEVILSHMVKVLRLLVDGRGEADNQAIAAALVELEAEVEANAPAETVPVDPRDARIAELEAKLAGY